MIVGPVIGAAIGYCTNYIAVKMLFRPLKPIKIGNFKVPFTPGIIPKGKNRLGKAIGEAIGGTLLTQEDLAKTMLSEEMKQKISSEVRLIFQKNMDNPKGLGILIKEYIGQETYEVKKHDISLMLTEKLVSKAAEVSIGSIIANEAVKVVKQKVQGTILAMMVNDQLLSTFIQPISEGIDNYIADNGVSMLEPKLEEEIDKATQKTIGDAFHYLKLSEINIEEIVVKIYEQVVHSRLGAALEQIDISGIVEQKINEMDVMELEQLVLSVMKKELNAVVNLGAIIGFVLGLFNLLF